MMQAAQRYPAEPLQPTVAPQRATVCSISNAIATSGCVAAGTAYDVDLPVNRIPGDYCQVQGGSPTLLGQRSNGFSKKSSHCLEASFGRFADSLAGNKAAKVRAVAVLLLHLHLNFHLD